MTAEHVYVDAVTVYSSETMDAHTRRNGTRWSHMWCDPGAEDELHRIALAIGLKREWFQAHGSLDHYDVTPPKRALAIRAGAVELSLREWMRRETPEQRTARRNRRIA